MFFTFARFARFPRSRDHPEGLLAVYLCAHRNKRLIDYGSPQRTVRPRIELFRQRAWSVPTLLSPNQWPSYKQVYRTFLVS